MTGYIQAVVAAFVLHVAVDAWLGKTAEYFNAWHVLCAWGLLIAGGDPLSIVFLSGQSQLGDWALPTATAIMIVSALAFGGVLLGLCRLLIVLRGVS